MTTAEKLEFLAKMAETGEIFKITFDDDNPSMDVYFQEGQLKTVYSGASSISFNVLIDGNIEEHSFTPEFGDKYWFVTGKICDDRRKLSVSNSNWEFYTIDYERYYTGNCFKTEEEAWKNVKIIKERLLNECNE